MNDIGFLSQTDQMTQWIWMQHRILKPFSIFRSMRNNIVQYQNWDFDWRNTSAGYEYNNRLEFKNFWIVNFGGNYETHTVSNADLRGGPAIHYPGSLNLWGFIATDQRKKLQVGIGPSWRVGFDSYARSAGVDMDIVIRPTNALSLVLSPSFTKSLNTMQYVDTPDANGEDRYVVGEIDQTIARFTMRGTYMLTPNLSVQYWGQFYGSSGAYTKFKSVTDADAGSYSERFNWIESEEIEEDVYSVDEDGDGNTDYTFDKPDFNFGQFRSNMVVRWEYIPGSTVFLVWTQEKNGSFYDARTSEHDRYSFDFEDKPHNIFLLKFTYRFIL
jgi:hypothetical protein